MFDVSSVPLLHDLRPPILPSSNPSPPFLRLDERGRKKERAPKRAHSDLSFTGSYRTALTAILSWEESR